MRQILVFLVSSINGEAVINNDLLKEDNNLKEDKNLKEFNNLKEDNNQNFYKTENITAEDFEEISNLINESKFDESYQRFISMKQILKDSSSNSYKRFKNEFSRFLIQIGEFKNEFLEKEKLVNLENIKWLQSYDFMEKAKLENTANYNFDVMVALCKKHIKNKNFTELNRIIQKIEYIINQNQNSVYYKYDIYQFYEIKARSAFLSKNIHDGLKYIADSKNNNSVIENYEKFQRKIETENLYDLREAYQEIFRLSISDKFKPSVYTPLLIKVCEKISDFALLRNVKQLSFFADKLFSLEQTEKNLIILIRVLLTDEKFETAKTVYNKNVKIMSWNVKQELSRIIESEIKEKRMEEERKREEQQRRRREEEQRRRREEEGRYNKRNTYNPSSKAGTDFLNYYKVLGCNKNVDQKTLKKMYKKKAKLANRKINMAGEKDKKEGEEELLKVNKAYQILSNEKNKAIYDSGQDPENPEPQYHQRQRSFDDFEDIFRMFGQGGGRGGGQHFFFSF